MGDNDHEGGKEGGGHGQPPPSPPPVDPKVVEDDKPKPLAVAPAHAEQKPQEGHQPEHEAAHQVEANRPRFWKRPSLTDWVMMAATVVIAIATVVNVVYVGGQLAEMRSGSGQTDQLIKANTDLASAAVKEADALTGQLSIMQKQLVAVHNGQRAWVAIGVVMKPIAVGQKLEAVVTFSNVSRTPAFKVLTLVNGFGLGASDPSPEPMISLPADTGTKEGNGKVILPSTTVTSGVQWADDQPITQIQFDGLQRKSDVLWVTARVEYFDDEGSPHSTTLRASYDFANTSFLSVNPGNDAD
jgi:hypothetical protein